MKLFSTFIRHRGGAARSILSASAKSALVSVAASLIYSAASPPALCESKSGNSSGGGDDEDFLSKIKSKIDAQSLPPLPEIDIKNNEVLNSVATALGSQISLAISSGIPTDVSYGFFAGYFSGLALKKIGKVASVVLGVGFLGIQTLAYHGYVDVHHEKLQKQVGDILDRNKDGVVDTDDLKSALDEVRKVAGFGIEDNKNLMASGGGFGLGFVGGLRSG